MKDTFKINKYINIDYNYFNLKLYIRDKIMCIILVITITIMAMFFSIVMFGNNDNISCLSLITILLNLVSIIVANKIKEAIDKDMELFEDYLKYELTNKLSYKLLDSVIEKLDKNKFHICRELNEEGDIEHWYIYEREKLFDPATKPILDSNKNNLMDLEIFINKLKKEK